MLNFADLHESHRTLHHKLDTIIANQEKIMTAIADFAAKQQAFNDEIAADLTSISTQITALNATIATLQNSSGTISPEDQATLDDLQAKGTALAAQADATAGKTPPALPAGQ